MEDLNQMCATEEEKERINTNRFDMTTVYEKQEFDQGLVYQSLPVYVDVRFCSGKDVPLFQISQESVCYDAMSSHADNLMQYDCCLYVPQEFYNYTVESA